MEVVERVCGLPFLRHGNGPYLLDSVSIDCTEKCGGNTVHFNSSKNSLALIHAGIKFDRYSLDYIPPSFFFLSFFFPFPFPFFSNNRPNEDEILKSFFRHSDHSLSNQKLPGLYAFLNIFIGIGDTCIYYRTSILLFRYLKGFKSSWNERGIGKNSIGKMRGWERSSSKSRYNLLTTLFVDSVPAREWNFPSERKSWLKFGSIKTRGVIQDHHKRPSTVINAYRTCRMFMPSY